jgi:transposase
MAVSSLTPAQEIEARRLIEAGGSNRSVAAAFGVGRMVIQRLRDRWKQEGIEPDVKPVASRPEPIAPRPLVSRFDEPDEEVIPPGGDPFDVRGESYPYERTDRDRADALAEQLRQVHRRFGTEAARSMVLEGLLSYDLAGLSTEVIARKFDVTPRTIRRWRAALKDELRDRLDFKPEDRIAERMATFDQMSRLIWRKLLANPSPAEWATALAGLSRIEALRLNVEDRTGISDRMRLPPPDPREPQVVAIQHSVQDILDALGGAEDDMSPEDEYTEAVRNRLIWIERNPDKPAPPEVDFDDPHGWSPDVQSCRRLQVRQRADRYKGKYHRDDDRDPIPGWPHLPPISQCGPVIAYLRDLAAAEAEPEPAEEDTEDALA